VDGAPAAAPLRSLARRAAPLAAPSYPTPLPPGQALSEDSKKRWNEKAAAAAPPDAAPPAAADAPPPAAPPAAPPAQKKQKSLTLGWRGQRVT